MNEEEEYPYYEYPDYEYRLDFEGCTCEHDPGMHGRGTCAVDGCPCEGGWTV